MNRIQQTDYATRSRPIFAFVLAIGASLAWPTNSATAIDKLFSRAVNSLDEQYPFYVVTLQAGGAYVPFADAQNEDEAIRVLADNKMRGYPLVLGTAVGLDHQLHPNYTMLDLLNEIHAGGYQLDYIIMDMEPRGRFTVETNNLRIQQLIEHVRNNYNGFFANTKFGNYSYYSGASDVISSPNPHIATERAARQSARWHEKRIAYDEFYNGIYVIKERPNPLGGNLTVAMPQCYVHSFYIHHASEKKEHGLAGWERPHLSPTQRSALFWAPLETFSHAKRKLPQGHELIPWVADYGQDGSWVPDKGQEPTREDNAASITHYRLRGADGVQVYGQYIAGNPPHVPPDVGYVPEEDSGDGRIQYRRVVAAGWKAVDPLFANPGVTRYLNAAVSPDEVTDRTKHFATNKTGGVEWSAAQKGNRVMAIVSNLSGSTKSTDDLIGWTDRPQLPNRLQKDVQHGAHVLFQFRASDLDNNNMEQYDSGQTMNNQGAGRWSGPEADEFKALPTPGCGNSSDIAVVTTGAHISKQAWYANPNGNPGYTSADRVVYSAWLYRHGSTIGFSPSNADDASSESTPDDLKQGARIVMQLGNFKFNQAGDSGSSYTATNVSAEDQEWYEVQMVVDPANGSDGTAAVFVRNITAGERDFTRLVWDDPDTTDTVEQLWELPLLLNTAGTNRKTTDFDGWTIVAYGADNAIDNLNTGYYVPRMNDNFEHYDDSVTNDNQTVAWNGPAVGGPSKWQVDTPDPAGGNDSNFAAELVDGSTASAWWNTENPQFTATDLTVYSAQVFSGDGSGAAEIFFGAVNTDNVDTDGLVPDSQFGFTAGFSLTGGFHFSVPGGRAYSSDFIFDDDTGYEIQIQIDPTANNGDGAARVWIKDLTHNSTPRLLKFDGGDLQDQTLIPLALSSANNPTVWDGWQVSGSGDTVQIDSLRSFLFPYTDFDAYNLYIDDPDFSVLSNHGLCEAQQNTDPE